MLQECNKEKLSVAHKETKNTHGEASIYTHAIIINMSLIPITIDSWF